MHDPVHYEVRAARRDDFDGLCELSRYLDSVNLPNDPSSIQSLLEVSERSFSGTIGDPRRREYVFVLRELSTDKVIGSSMILGQLGRKDAPYIYFDVLTEEKYSSTLDKHFVHKVLSMGYSYNGPTEIGGLVVHPDYRKKTSKFGMLISYVRFLWMAIHRADFQEETVAELLPPLEPDGTSLLWEAVGRRFTEMSYKDADRLSKKNKEFIRNLFPEGDIYVSLLSPEAQAVVGAVGPQTRGVERMLRRIGFRYADRVDPFDGGPHFVAPTDEILLIRRSSRLIFHACESAGTQRALVGREYDGPPWFCAVPSLFQLNPDGSVDLPAETASYLSLSSGEPCWVLGLRGRGASPSTDME